MVAPRDPYRGPWRPWRSGTRRDPAPWPGTTGGRRRGRVASRLVRHEPAGGAGSHVSAGARALAALASASCFLSFSRSSLACSASLWALSLATLAASFRYAEALGSLLIPSSELRQTGRLGLVGDLVLRLPELGGVHLLGERCSGPGVAGGALSSDVRTFDPALPVVPLSSDVRTFAPVVTVGVYVPWGSVIQLREAEASHRCPRPGSAEIGAQFLEALESGLFGLRRGLIAGGVGRGEVQVGPVRVEIGRRTYPGTVVVVSVPEAWPTRTPPTGACGRDPGDHRSPRQVGAIVLGASVPANFLARVRVLPNDLF